MSNSETIIATIAPYLDENETVFLEYVEKVLNYEDFAHLVELIPRTSQVIKIYGLIFCDMKQVWNSNRKLWAHFDQNQLSEILIYLVDRGCFIKNGRAIMEHYDKYAVGFVHKDTVVNAFYNVPHGCVLFVNSKYDIREDGVIQNLYNVEDVEAENMNVLEELVMFKNLCCYNKYLKRILLESYFHFTLISLSDQNVLHIANQLFGNAEIVEQESVPVESEEDLTQHITAAIDLGEEMTTIWPFHIDAEIKQLVIANINELDLLITAAQ